MGRPRDRDDLIGGVRIPRLSELLSRDRELVELKVVEAIRSRGIRGILRELGKYLRGLDEVAVDILSGLAVGRHVWIIGPVGCGKTTLAESIAEILSPADPPYMEVACHSHMTATELTGDIDIAVALQAGLDHPLSFVPGPLILAHGRILILDEVNRLSPYSQAALLQALQEHYVFVRGFRIRTDFLMIATANPVEYAGVYELSEALADRMKQVEIDVPDRELLKAIIAWKASSMLEHIDATIPDEFVEIVATMAKLMYSDKFIEVGPSVRSCIYALASTMARTWIKGVEPTIDDLRREVVSNFASTIRFESESGVGKREYVGRKFDEALIKVRSREARGSAS